MIFCCFFFFFQAEDGIRDRSPSRGLGDVYKRQPGISALLLRRGVDWGAPDGKPVDLVFMIAVPPGSESLHLQILARLVNLMSRSDLVESLRTASNPHRFVELIAKAENACFAE